MEVFVSRNSFEGNIVLNVASSGITSLLLPRRRTTHSRFKISISVNEDSVCNIKWGCALAKLIARVKLIIWDRAPMIYKHSVEVVDRTFKDIMSVCNEFSIWWKNCSFLLMLMMMIIRVIQLSMLFVKKFFKNMNCCFSTVASTLKNEDTFFFWHCHIITYFHYMWRSFSKNIWAVHRTCI